MNAHTSVPAMGKVGVWYGMVDLLATPQARQAAQAIEALGYGSLWVAEAVGRDPFVSCSILAGATERLVLATGIANVYARDAMSTAAAQKTLAEAYPGRFLMGLGVSHGHLVAGVRKHEWNRPYSYMVEYLAAMRSALFMAVPPAEEPPTVLAALGPKMLELAATQTAGAHPYLTTPDHTEFARSIMGEGPLLAPEQMVILESDPIRAREIARAGLAMYTRLPNYRNNLLRLGFTENDFDNVASDRLVDAVVAWGDEEVIVDRVGQHLDAGADHVCVQVLTGRMDSPVPELERLAPGLLSL